MSANVLRLMHSWPHTPAYVVGPTLDVLAINPLASVFYRGLLRQGGNVLRMVFLDPAARRFYPEWEEVARNRVAQFRSIAGDDLSDPAVSRVAGELWRRSGDFRRLWARQEAFDVPREDKRFHHALLGELTLSSEVFQLSSAPGQHLVALQAEPASFGAYALDLLGDLAPHSCRDRPPAP